MPSVANIRYGCVASSCCNNKSPLSSFLPNSHWWILDFWISSLQPLTFLPLITLYKTWIGMISFEMEVLRRYEALLDPSRTQIICNSDSSCSLMCHYRTTGTSHQLFEMLTQFTQRQKQTQQSNERYNRSTQKFPDHICHYSAFAY